MSRSSKAEYLGDAVYADVDPLGGVVLTTEDGIMATNRIVLEFEVMDALLNWHARVVEETRRGE